MLINNLKKIFFKEKFKKNKIKNILENIIDISKSDSFYKKYKISNEFIHRFEIIIIFIYLIFNRLKDENKYKNKLQDLYDCLFDYIDYSLREIGVGDLAVGKKVKKFAQIFSLRIKMYDRSFGNDIPAIQKLIKKYIYKNNKINEKIVKKFTNYILNEKKKLHSTKSEKIFIKNLFQQPM